MYLFKNILENSAINITLEDTYIDSSSEEETIISKDVITLYKGVIHRETITFMNLL